MYRWRKEIERINIDARRVCRLHRSLGDIQVALAGLPSQEATAYLCAFEVQDGFQVVVALHLKQSGRLACYFAAEKPVRRDLLDRSLEEGIRFAESMGFMMGDTDIHCLEEKEKEDFWNALPLKEGGRTGTSGAEPEEEPAEEPEELVEEPEELVEEAEELVEEAEELVEEAEELVEEAEDRDREVSKMVGGAASELEERLDASRRGPPSEEERDRRRKKFLAGVGRFLSSF